MWKKSQEQFSKLILKTTKSCLNNVWKYYTPDVQIGQIFFSPFQPTQSSDLLDGLGLLFLGGYLCFVFCTGSTHEYTSSNKHKLYSLSFNIPLIFKSQTYLDREILQT